MTPTSRSRGRETTIDRLMGLMKGKTLTERLEKSPHKFWLETCGINNRRRSSNHARLDTPWNGFTPDHILVCTLWRDEILSVFDEIEDRTRQFVKIGGKMRRWLGPAIAHGKHAEENLQRSFREKRRVVGYEAEPNPTATDRSIAYFYMSRPHELQRMSEFSHGDTLRRLGINEMFAEHGRRKNDIEIQAGVVFELVAQKGPFPGATAANVDHPETPNFDSGGNAQNGEQSDLAQSDAEEPAVGNLSNEAYASVCIPLLIAHVLRQQDEVLHTLTYTELAALLGRRDKHGQPYPRGLGKVLGRAMELIDQVAERVGAVPYLTTIVVLKSDSGEGVPGDGVCERWHGYPSMSMEEKRAKVLREQVEILRFGSRWNEVLAALGMQPIDATIARNPPFSGFGGGESDAHKKLKAYVRTHPEQFGADATWEAFEEYALRSADTVDVFFKSPSVWIGVEVKSAVSDGVDGDYQRGLFQVVKYEALLNAQARADQLPIMPTIKVLLVLESSLPAALRTIADTLEIEVHEQCGVTQGEPN
jgi:hypothetical protein